MGFCCEGGAGVGAAGYVVRALRDCGYANVYARVPSVFECCEPIVVRQRGWERLARLDDGHERGVERTCAYVCMDGEADCAATAYAVARDLEAANWRAVPVGGAGPIADVDVAAPVELGRDGSGRWVRSVEVLLTVVRPCGEE